MLFCTLNTHGCKHINVKINITEKLTLMCQNMTYLKDIVKNNESYSFLVIIITKLVVLHCHFMHTL